jgi:signal transduction histidine kinase
MTDTPIARVLIVDDEAQQVRALCDTLSDHGYETVGFVAAAPALEALRDQKFDLLLSDLMMPHIDGITLFKSARIVDPDLVGIIMTGEGTIATAVDAMKSGALDYILKPFKLSAILPVLARAVAMRRLRAENASLQHRLGERAAELEAANKELEAFSSSVSHDLRAPLRAIGGLSKILGESHTAALDAEGRRILGMIGDNVRRMNTLIDDLLAFSQLGRKPIAARQIDTAALVREVVEEMRRQYTGTWPTAIVETLPACRADPALLRQVWINLISNAVKYSAKTAAPALRITGSLQASEVVFSIQDNGAGFDMSSYDKLFGAFQRLHSDSEFEGTGLGLAIVQRIVLRHGGRVWAEGKPGEGATFHFSLPSHQPAND